MRLFCKLWNHCLPQICAPWPRGQSVWVQLAKRKGKESEMNYDPSKCSDGRARKVVNSCPENPPKPTSQKGSQPSAFCCDGILIYKPNSRPKRAEETTLVGLETLVIPAGVITSRWCESCSIKLVNKCVGKLWRGCSDRERQGRWVLEYIEILSVHTQTEF